MKQAQKTLIFLFLCFFLIPKLEGQEIVCDTTKTNRLYEECRKLWGDYEKGLEKIDKAIQEITSCEKKYPSLLARYYDEKGIIYRYGLHNLDLAEVYFEKELEIIRENNLPEITAKNCYYNLATCCRLRLNYAKGISYGLKSLEITQKDTTQLASLANIHGTLANLYFDNSELIKALYHYEEALCSTPNK